MRKIRWSFHRNNKETPPDLSLLTTLAKKSAAQKGSALFSIFKHTSIIVIDCFSMSKQPLTI